MSTIVDYSVKKNPLVGYSFNKVYDFNLCGKSDSKVTQYLLVSDFIFDLPRLQTIAIEKKTMQVAFKKRLGQELGNGSQIQSVRLVVHCLDNSQNFSNSSTAPSTLFQKPHIHNFQNINVGDPSVAPLVGKESNRGSFSPSLPYGGKEEWFPFGKGYQLDIGKNACLLGYKNTSFDQFPLLIPPRRIDGLEKINMVSNTQLKDKQFYHKKTHKTEKFHFTDFKWNEFFGTHLMCADWILNKLISQLSVGGKRSPRPILNQFVNDLRLLMKSMGSTCPVLGVRVALAGRLSNQKKAMAQEITKCIGKVPLSNFRQSLDYSQHFLYTRFGIIGIKVWVCYRLN